MVLKKCIEQFNPAQAVVIFHASSKWTKSELSQTCNVIVAILIRWLAVIATHM